MRRILGRRSMTRATSSSTHPHNEDLLETRPLSIKNRLRCVQVLVEPSHVLGGVDPPEDRALPGRPQARRRAAQGPGTGTGKSHDC